MARKPSKSKPRPRNAVSDVKANGQIEGDDAGSAGDGQAGTVGLAVSGNAGTESQKDYSELVAIVVAHNKNGDKPLISRVWHPEGQGETWKETSMWIGTNYADVPVLNGKASYQLSTGEIIEL